MSSLDLRLFTEVSNELGDHIEKTATEIVLGRAGDFADYRYRIGQLKGLRDALAILESAQRRVLGVSEDER